ncbi:DUF624 domain-containing protein [Litoreibacter albidus]|uniref:Membrane protein YesL n=1 Tax=Litoreibacter albidus TaxID=670155 RepID=A0A1H3CJ57_9RHOB|nr:DUF624 domain-containing protein [Litoreibacter albidus]SDX54282.1 Protein of unknown function, DUF624 [Litoreibacter albidus]
MNWWLNFYFGEGRGIPKDAPEPVGWRRLWATVAREWWGLIQLNLLFIGTALPLVTLPAAFAAMTAVLATMDADEPCEVWRDYWRGFARSWATATALGLGFGVLIAAGIFVVSFYAAAAAAQPLLYALPLTVAAVCTVFIAVTGCVALFLAATHVVPVGVLLRSAALTVVIRFWPLSLAMLANALIWIAHVVGYPATILLAVLCNFSFGALLLVFACRKAADDCIEYTMNRAGLAAYRQPSGTNKRPENPA